jgi:hypothetical protein
MFRTLDPGKILETAQALERRVSSRFPERGLTRVPVEMVGLTRATIADAETLVPPIWWLRVLILAVVLGGAALFLSVGSLISFSRLSREAIGSVESIEAGINTLVLAALGLAALVGPEGRIKRRRVTKSLHALRSVIHVIDMHQLTKDPSVFQAGYAPTAASPDRAMTPRELERYLDYCSELLAITGKLAALYAQAVPDEGVAQAVNDIESLGSNLSRKIWQKITLIDERMIARA